MDDRRPAEGLARDLVSLYGPRIEEERRMLRERGTDVDGWVGYVIGRPPGPTKGTPSTRRRDTERRPTLRVDIGFTSLANLRENCANEVDPQVFNALAEPRDGAVLCLVAIPGVLAGAVVELVAPSPN